LQVGFELTGELTHTYPDKKLTLVHSKSELLSYETLPKKFSEKATAEVKTQGKNVTVLLDQRLQFDEKDTEILKKGNLSYLEGKRELKTSKGETVNSDLIFFCTGAHVNNASFQKTLPLDGEGRIKVNEFLQVEGTDTTFAFGDCAAIESKMGYFATLQASIIAKNIQALESKKKLTKYKKAGGAMIAPFGPKRGVATLGGMILGSFVTSFIKGGDLMTKMQWNEMHAKIAKPNQETKKTDLQRRASVAELEAVMGMDKKQIEEIIEKGLGSEKKVEEGLVKT